MARSRADRRSRLGKLKASANVNMTSMMDILTTLLFFVLLSFVGGGEAATPPPGITLPASTAEAATRTSLLVAVDQHSILVGGERVATLEEALAGDDLVIEPLAAHLAAAREQMDDLARRKGEDPESAPRLVTLQGDSDVEFRVLQRVMYTLDQSGFPDIALAVLKRT